ncbi:MAG: hypothetical protein ACRBCS_10880 [Cellvibrionaceae bacterium]
MPSKTWSDIEESSSVWGIKFLFLVYKFLGRRVFTVFLFPAICYYLCAKPIARKASFDFIRRCQKIGAIPPKKRVLLLSLRHFMSFGSGILDKLSVWSGGINIAGVNYEGRESFIELISSGKGAVVIASHLGNVEVSRVVADTHKQVKLNILVHTKHAEKFNKILKELDKNSALNLMQVTDTSPATAVMLNEKIHAGESVVIAGDRTPVTGGGRHSVVNFLGEKACFPQGPYILASILKCPVYTLFCVRDGDNYKIIIRKLADKITLNRKTRDEELTVWVQKYASMLEELTLRYPMQWFNFYDFWKK